MIYLDVQDVPEAKSRGYADIVLVDYTGAHYQDLPRVYTKTQEINTIIKTGTVLDTWHFDLTVPGMASVLEQLVYSGWQEPYTVNGVYVPELLPIRCEPQPGCGARRVGTPVYPASVEYLQTEFIRGAWEDPVRFPPWALIDPPVWAKHTSRWVTHRKWRQGQLHALGAAQVGLREEWLRLSNHSIRV